MYHRYDPNSPSSFPSIVRIDRTPYAILYEVPRPQKCISVKKWQQMLGEFRSLVIALSGSSDRFSLFQEVPLHQSEGRIRLSRGVHNTLLQDMR